MKSKFVVGAWLRASAVLALMLFSSGAWAKGYKSGEYITTNHYGFGAFEARIRSAQGPGVISTFFLWKPGSDTAPAVPWEEIDFEMGSAGGDYQTQIMTPGSSPPLFRTEHAVLFDLPSRAWQAYYTYRIEWTPQYIAFFVDGKQVRRETDPVKFAALFNTDASGNVPVNERMELRTGAWPGTSSIATWAGNFDGKSVPTGHFVDYVKVWAYTPSQANPFATLLLDDEFNAINSSNWYFANWTFDFSASDYISQNIGTVDGRLVVALTTDAAQGLLPTPPPDVPPPSPSVPDGFVIEAESYDAFFDTTPGNSGLTVCSLTNVDATITTDPKGGNCIVGWTAAGEWLEYDIQLPHDDEYELTVRLASLSKTPLLHVEVDGVNVSGPISGPGNGWQTYSDALVPGVFLSAGPHVIRLAFDQGEVNVNYLAFERVPPAGGLCEMSCDDGNPCTTDSCDSVLGCQFQNNTLGCADDGNACTGDVCSAGVCTHPNNSAACADDGNACTNDVCSAGACTHPNNTASCADDGSACTFDVCSAGACTHPANGTCSTGTPCSGLCTSPIKFTSSSFNSGNLGNGATCYETTAALNGGNCGNFASGRVLTVNGVQIPCTGNWPAPLPTKHNGGYCVQTTAGGFNWGYFVTW